MKLRSRLFLNSSALITVALLGLLLGMFSVLQLTKTQNQAMTHNLSMLDATLGLRLELGKQLILLLPENLDHRALQASDRRFNDWLGQVREGAIDDRDRQAVSEIGRAYALYEQLLDKPLPVRHQLLGSAAFGQSVEDLRERINAVQMGYFAALQSAEQRSQERATLIAALLGLIGLAVLLLGFVTAHSIAQHFGQPLEALTLAVERISQGDFQVNLPPSPVAELSSLSQRFGVMAESLRRFKNSDVETLLTEQRRLQAVLDSIDDGLLIFDRSGLLDHFNQVAQRQLGWYDQPRGVSISQALQRPGLDEQLQRVMRGEGLEQAPEDLEVEADGETRLLTYSLTPVSLSEERIHGAVMVLHDVTEQRAFERVRNEFVLRASHELRTPVTGMHMAFGLLQERLHFPAEARESKLLHTVDEEMRRLLVMIS